MSKSSTCGICCCQALESFLKDTISSPVDELELIRAYVEKKPILLSLSKYLKYLPEAL